MVEKEISGTLRRVRRRLTAVRTFESGVRFGLYGTMLAALCVAVSALVFSFLPESYPYPWAPLVVIPLSFLVGVVLRLVRPVTLRDAAVYLDRRAGLEERVATAHELASTDDDSELGAMVREQAAEVCRRFRPGQIRYTRRLRTDGRYLVVALIVCGAVLFLPPLRTQGYRERQLVEARREAARKQLEIFLHPERKEAFEEDERLSQLRRQLERTIEELAPGSAMTPERMFASLNRMKGELDRELARSEAERDLAEAAESAKKSESLDGAFRETSAGEDARSELAEKIASGRLSPEEKAALSRLTDAAADAAQTGDNTELGRAAAELGRALESGQGNAASLAESLEKVAGAANQAATAQEGEGAAEREREIADAMRAVEEAKRKAAGESAGGKTAGRGSQDKQCPTCGGTGKDAAGKPCPDCGGTGKQPGQGSSSQSRTCPDCGGSGKDASGKQCATCSGAGRVVVDPRSGSTNMEQPGGPGDKSEQEEVNPEGEFVSIYDSRAMPHTTEQVTAPGEIGEGKSAGMRTIYAGPDSDERAKITFSQQFTPETARAAEEALEDMPIPADMRDLVRRYFTPDIR